MKPILQLSAVAIAVLALFNASVLVAQSKDDDADNRVAMASVPKLALKQVAKQLLPKDDLSPDPGWETVYRIEAQQEVIERQVESASERDDPIEQDRLMQDWDRLEHDKEHAFDIPEPDIPEPDIPEPDIPEPEAPDGP